MLGFVPCESITREYKKLAIKLHPDRKGGNKQLFQRLVNEYEQAQRRCDTAARAATTVGVSATPSVNPSLFFTTPGPQTRTAPQNHTRPAGYTPPRRKVAVPGNPMYARLFPQKRRSGQYGLFGDDRDD